MVKSRTGWIGVDLGAAAIKLVQLERDADGVQVSASAVMQRDMPEEALHSDAMWSSHEIRAALELDSRFRGGPSACILPLHQAGLRMFSMPRGTDDESHAMIANQLFEVLGTQIADYEFDYWTSDSATEGDVDAGAVYVSREKATQTARRLAGAGVPCEVLDGLPMALARAVQWSARPGEAMAVVDWGHTDSLLVVGRDEQPLFARTLRDCGYRRMLQAVTAQLELSPHDAQQLLSLYGVAGICPPDEDRAAEMSRLLSQLVAEPLLSMQQELTRTLEHLRLHRKEMSPAGILLCGGGATIRNIDSLLSLRLDLPVEVWRLPGRDDRAQAHPELAPIFAAAAALSALAWTA